MPIAELVRNLKFNFFSSGIKGAVEILLIDAQYHAAFLFFRSLKRDHYPRVFVATPTVTRMEA